MEEKKDQPNPKKDNTKIPKKPITTVVSNTTNAESHKPKTESQSQNRTQKSEKEKWERNREEIRFWVEVLMFGVTAYLVFQTYQQVSISKQAISRADSANSIAKAALDSSANANRISLQLAQKQFEDQQLSANFSDSSTIEALKISNENAKSASLSAYALNQSLKDAERRFQIENDAEIQITDVKLGSVSKDSSSIEIAFTISIVGAPHSKIIADTIRPCLASHSMGEILDEKKLIDEVMSDLYQDPKPGKTYIHKEGMTINKEYFIDKSAIRSFFNETQCAILYGYIQYTNVVTGRKKKYNYVIRYDVGKGYMYISNYSTSIN